MIFIAVIFGFSPFFIWGRLFLPERKVFPTHFIQAHFIQAHFARRFHKNPTAPPRKAPTQKTPGASSAPERAFGNTPTKRPRARRAFTARLYLACRRAPRKAPASARPKPLKNYPFGALYRKPCLVYAHKGPHAKTPGVIPGVWLMKSSFNLLLTHCGRFLAGCTGPACSRRPQ